MKQVFLLLLVHMACNLTVQAQQPSVRGTTYAVVIGISKYNSKALPVLQYADRDAQFFAEYLQSAPAGNLPAHHIKLLLNGQATIAAIYNALEWLRQQCRRGDTGYVYFSGHGDVETKSKFSLGYLLAFNSPATNYRNNAIRLEDVNDWANRFTLVNKAKLILITDACHSGKLAGDFYKGKQLVGGELREVLYNEVRITSCDMDEEAAEGPDWGGGRGVFSYYLLMGLAGKADLGREGQVRVDGITKFLDSCLASDKYLVRDKHKQHPVINGDPRFRLAVPGSSNANIPQSGSDLATSTHGLSAPLQALAAIGVQPIDYFFSLGAVQPLEDYVDFENDKNSASADLPLFIVGARIDYQRSLAKMIDSMNRQGQGYEGNDQANLDSLLALQKQLVKNQSLRSRFVDQFIELVHNKGQQMINAYLEGDLAELEKRQYYYSGSRGYRNFLVMLKTALAVVPPDHPLFRILKIDYYYLSGLIDRLEMATSSRADSLLKTAIMHQRRALKLEPYAAYIQNELGNLFLHRKMYDSARIYYDHARALSPTWAIPWSNQVRLYLALNKLDKARQAIHTADSLQPGLAYLMVNAGLVMERSGDWLAAESFYLKAIANNNVHYLPYERLGKLYIHTGEYEKADSLLLAAEIRKQDFSINDEYFDFGVELGGAPRFDEEARMMPVPCYDGENDADRRSYFNLFKVLDGCESGMISGDTLVSLLRHAAAEFPSIPLIHHYLGKALLSVGNHGAAEKELLQSQKTHESPAMLVQRIRDDLPGRGTNVMDSCLLMNLVGYDYPVIEDHYLLAAVYEQEGKLADAIDQYELASAIENRRQVEQAAYRGFDEEIASARKSGSLQESVERLLKEFDDPIPMCGAVKTARLQQQNGRFLEAEQTLLKQVALNRAAGNLRAEALLALKPGTWNLPGGSPFNFYWLSVNRMLECEVYDFYRHMINSFPRDFEWYEKAGLFLHRRLSLCFGQMSAENYGPFYRSMSNYAYPFMDAEQPRADTSISIRLPGTGETLTVEAPSYDPLIMSLKWLRMSVKLSGEVNAPPLVQEAIADLASWTGDHSTAIKEYAALVSVSPQNDSIRTKLVNELIASFDYVAAARELDVLFRSNRATAPQRWLLAEYRILGRQFGDAAIVLKAIQPQNDNERLRKAILETRMHWLNGQPAKALACLRDSFPTIIIDPADDLHEHFAINIEKAKAQHFRLYSIARMRAMLKDPLAIRSLKLALDSGFNLKYVLDNDPAMATLRRSVQWKALLSRYELHALNPTEPRTTLLPAIAYRIPHYQP